MKLTTAFLAIGAVPLTFAVPEAQDFVTSVKTVPHTGPPEATSGALPALIERDGDGGIQECKFDCPWATQNKPCSCFISSWTVACTSVGCVWNTGECSECDQWVNVCKENGGHDCEKGLCEGTPVWKRDGSDFTNPGFDHCKLGGICNYKPCNSDGFMSPSSMIALGGSQATSVKAATISTSLGFVTLNPTAFATVVKRQASDVKEAASANTIGTCTYPDPKDKTKRRNCLVFDGHVCTRAGCVPVAADWSCNDCSNYVNTCKANGLSDCENKLCTINDQPNGPHWIHFSQCYKGAICGGMYCGGGGTKMPRDAIEEIEVEVREAVTAPTKVVRDDDRHIPVCNKLFKHHCIDLSPSPDATEISAVTAAPVPRADDSWPPVCDPSIDLTTHCVDSSGIWHGTPVPRAPTDIPVCSTFRQKNCIDLNPIPLYRNTRRPAITAAPVPRADDSWPPVCDPAIDLTTHCVDSSGIWHGSPVPRAPIDDSWPPACDGVYYTNHCIDDTGYRGTPRAAPTAAPVPRAPNDDSWPPACDGVYYTNHCIDNTGYRGTPRAIATVTPTAVLVPRSSEGWPPVCQPPQITTNCESATSPAPKPSPTKSCYYNPLQPPTTFIPTPPVNNSASTTTSTSGPTPPPNTKTCGFSNDDRCSDFGCLIDPKDPNKPAPWCEVCDMYMDACKASKLLSEDDCRKRLCTSRDTGMWDYCSADESAGGTRCGMQQCRAYIPAPPVKNQTCTIKYPTKWSPETTCLYSKEQGRCTDVGCIEGQNASNATDPGDCTLCNKYTSMCEEAAFAKDQPSPAGFCSNWICEQKDTGMLDICGKDSGTVCGNSCRHINPKPPQLAKAHLAA